MTLDEYQRCQLRPKTIGFDPNDTEYQRTFGSSLVSSRTIHVLTITTQESAQEPYDVLSQCWDQTGQSANIIYSQLVLISYFMIPTCSVEHNLAPSLGHPKCTFTIHFFSLALKDTFFLLILEHWTPIIWDFISIIKLLPYHLQSLYRHFPYLLIFNTCQVLAPVWYLLSFLI